MKILSVVPLPVNTFQKADCEGRSDEQKRLKAAKVEGVVAL
jgi:hypothetical protein